MQSMHSTCTWAQKSFDTSHLQGPVSISKQWSHHPPHQTKKARYYNGLGFGINVYLRSHIDVDFTMSIVQAHIDNHTDQINDRIICYFAFPRIGVSVALQPGDFLLFNPSEPHCVSSCCTADDDI
jgi:hypothetical protein